MEFERATGEITGGMGANIVATVLLVMAGSAVVGFSTMPLLPGMLGLAIIAIAFPIAFYPISRALWIAMLYVTQAHEDA